jgi:hypothetical protein
MARQYVFLVHGIGLHPASTWADSFKAAIHAALQNYAPFKGMSASNIESKFLVFIPVSYDDIFEGYRERTADLMQSLAGAPGVSQQLAGTFAEIAASAKKDGGAEKFFWESALDAVLWQGLPAARDAVIARVNDQIGKGLKKLNKEGPLSRANIIAHSLGTSVTHDALVCLRYMQDDEGLFKPDSFKWESVSMVANVSRLLECIVPPSTTAPDGAFDPYRSCLKPGSSDSTCRKYLNFHHDGDPITWPRGFSPANWPMDSFTDVTTSRYADIKTVHDFELYFSDPAVHIPILRAILRTEDLCTDDEVKAAFQAFNDAHPNHATDEFNSLHALFNNDYDYKMTLPELAQFILKVYEELNA